MFALSGPEKDDPALTFPALERQRQAPTISHSGQFISVEIFSQQMHSKRFRLASGFFSHYGAKSHQSLNVSLRFFQFRHNAYKGLSTLCQQHSDWLVLLGSPRPHLRKFWAQCLPVKELWT